MKPAPFYYHCPRSLDDTLALLHELQEDDAKVLAGGQSLVPMLNMRLARVKNLIDINRISEMDYVRVVDGSLAIGALTRHRTLERSAEVASRVPLMAEALPEVGDRQVRFRGTVGGSLAHADPAAELPTIATALDAEMIIGRHGARRSVTATDFFQSVLTTVLEPDELLLEIRFPAPPPHSGHAFLELSRQRGTFAIVSAAAVVSLEEGRISSARLALGGVGVTPFRARAAEESLRGQTPGAEAFAEAGRLAAGETDPSSDVHGSDQYRKEMASLYAQRALDLAARRAAAV